jgi:hypothetical protein
VGLGQKGEGRHAMRGESVGSHVEHRETTGIAGRGESFLDGLGLIEQVRVSHPELRDQVLTESVVHSFGDPPSTEGFRVHLLESLGYAR